MSYAICILLLGPTSGETQHILFIRMSARIRGPDAIYRWASTLTRQTFVKNPTKNRAHLPWRRGLIRLDTSDAFFAVIIRRPSYEIMARARRQSSLSPLQRVRQVCRYVGFTKPSRLRVNLYRAQSKGFVAKRHFIHSVHSEKFHVV